MAPSTARADANGAEPPNIEPAVARHAAIASPGRGRARRQEVLQAAANLFATRGYHGTSMRDIADAMSMRAPSLYKYVSGKDDLLREIVHGYLDVLLPRLRAAADQPGDGATRLAAMMTASIEVGRGHLDEFLTLSNEWRQIQRIDDMKTLYDRTSTAIPLWTAAVSAGMQDGSLRHDLQPSRAVRIIIGITSSLIDSRFDDIDDLDTADRCKIGIEAALLGLRAGRAN